MTAKEGKVARAEPVVQAYEQALVVHDPDVPDALTALEDEMTSWTPDDSWSPNRLDALVHGVRRLLPLLQAGQARSASPARQQLGGSAGRLRARGRGCASRARRCGVGAFCVTVGA